MDSEPSEKFKELEKNKIVTTEKDGDLTFAHKKTTRISYYFVSESIFLLLSVILLPLSILQPDNFFYSYTAGYYTEYYALKGGVFSVSLIFFAFALLNTYMYIYKLEPTKRLKAYLIRFATIVLLFSNVIALSEIHGIYLNNLYAFEFFLFLYAFVSQISIKTYLVTTNKPTKILLFNKAASASPAENEWRKYNYASGILAIITGLFMLQLIWVFYHIIIRPIVMNKTKDRLIVESLEFAQEINLSTLSLELGIPLEDTIYRLKRMIFKREISGEFTRYGFILHEIRKTKRFTPKVAEKYEAFIKKAEKTERERHVSKFFEIAEREKLKEADFRRVLNIKKDFDLKHLVLLLPPNTITIRKHPINKRRMIIFHIDTIFMKRPQITETLLHHYDEIFNSKK